MSEQRARRAPRRRSRFMLVTAAVASMAAVAAASPAGAQTGEPRTPPAASSTPAPATETPSAEVNPDAAREVARQKRISVAEATRRLRNQKGLGERGALLEWALAGRTGGSYLDDTGQLVVTTLDANADQGVARNGARAQRVDDSAARLDDIKTQLDRRATGSGAGEVQGWYVDVPSNSVVVTVTEGATDARTAALVEFARSFGSSVRIEAAPAQTEPTTSAQYLAGGFQFVTTSGGTCSVGFNTRDSSNRNVVLTAGHCTTTSGNNSRNGYIIGANRTANFPTDDFGTFWNSYPSFWLAQPSVFKYDGTYIRLKGQWDNPPVGATVCKSGRTTGYTCGTIRALNQSVAYSNGIVNGLVRHDACVEKGDSGGSNISSGAFALGVTSGASLPTSGTFAGKCLSKQGGQNVSYYQPVGEALARNGLRLVL